MNVKLKLNLLLLACLLLPAAAAFGGCGDPAKPDNDAYIYPVLPGTEAWKTLISHDEMIAVCQVPENILKDMSISGLVETAIAYPMKGDVVFFDDKLGALNRILPESNAVRELLTRPDAAAALLAKYRAMDPAAYSEDWTDYTKLTYPLQFTAIEWMMVQDEMLDQFTPAQRLELLDVCRAKLDSKKDTTNMMGGMFPDTVNMLIIKLNQYGK